MNIADIQQQQQQQQQPRNNMFLGEDMSRMTQQVYVTTYIKNDELLQNFIRENNAEKYIQKGCFLVMETYKILMNFGAYYNENNIIREIYPKLNHFSCLYELMELLNNQDFLSNKIYEHISSFSYQQVISIKRILTNIDYNNTYEQINNPHFNTMLSEPDNIEIANNIADYNDDIYNTLWYAFNNININHNNNNNNNNNDNDDNYQRFNKLDCISFTVLENPEMTQCHIINHIKNILEINYSYDSNVLYFTKDQFESICSILANRVIDLKTKFKWILLNLNYEQLDHIGFLNVH